MPFHSVWPQWIARPHVNATIDLNSWVSEDIGSKDHQLLLWLRGGHIYSLVGCHNVATLFLNVLERKHVMYQRVWVNIMISRSIKFVFLRNKFTLNCFCNIMLFLVSPFLILSNYSFSTAQRSKGVFSFIYKIWKWFVKKLEKHSTYTVQIQ